MDSSTDEHVRSPRYSTVTEWLNFTLTNRIPRVALTRFMGWFSAIEQPLVRDLSLALWKRFADLRLHEAKKEQFSSLHDCFIRELKPGMRPVNPEAGVLASPCDAILGASGTIRGLRLFQIKGLSYSLDELLGDAELAESFRDGVYATLRITSSMYHRFHAPHDGRVTGVTYFSGDAWNVNPATLKRVEKLFVRNEHAVIRMNVGDEGRQILLVPVAAVLVASIRLHFLDVLLHLRYPGPNRIECDARLAKGEEMGWFQHGSTILVIAPAGFSLHADRRVGELVRAGEALMCLPGAGG